MIDFETKYNLMKEGGKILSEILKIIKNNLQEGKTGEDLNKLAEELIYSFGAEPAFKNYKAHFANFPYPYSICLSLNEIIVHGYPTKDVVLKNGDIVKVDLGIKYKGFYLDSAFTTYIGQIDQETKKLIEITKKALKEAIKLAKPGNKLGDIGWKIESTIEDAGFSVIIDFCGHGIGETLHQEPEIKNMGNPGEGLTINPGMFFTIEPMASLGSNEIERIDDYVFKTKDNSISTHFETTIVVLENNNEVLVEID
ncbi:MAG: type I methionyl aminopeptidase [Patescibacteria group bacterium]